MFGIIVSVREGVEYHFADLVRKEANPPGGGVPPYTSLCGLSVNMATERHLKRTKHGIFGSKWPKGAR